MTQHTNEILVLSETDLKKCVHLDSEVIAAVEEGFAQLWQGNAEVPPIIGLDFPESNGELDIKTAHIRGLDSFALKIASGFYDNPKRGLPVAGGLMMLISTITGVPKAVLLDNGYLTQVRTGAAGAIAAKYLAPERIDTVGMIGAGTQGRFQILALNIVRKFKKLLVFDLDPGMVEQYIEEMTPRLGIEIFPTSLEEDLVRESDLVITATPSRAPHLKAEWLHPGLHITAVGADAPGKQELFSGVSGLADILACDLKIQSVVRGEFHHALDDGTIQEGADIHELGQLITEQKTVRTNSAQISVCDLTGVGVQDTMIARMAYQKAISAGFK